MSGIDLSGVQSPGGEKAQRQDKIPLAEPGNTVLEAMSGMALNKADETAMAQATAGTMRMSVMRTAGGTMKVAAAIPVTVALELVQGIMSIFDHAIQAWGQVAIEQEYTKQVQVNAEAQVRQTEEKTRQVGIQARERTMALIIQARQNIESKRLEIAQLQVEISDKQQQRAIYQQSWQQIFQTLRSGLDDARNHRNEIWNVMRENGFTSPELTATYKTLSQDVDACLEKLVAWDKQRTPL